MTRAILISGNAYRFTEERREFERYLVCEVGIGLNQIKCFISGVTSALDVVMDIHVALTMSQKSTYPLILLYNGHGGKHAWALDEDQTLRYDALSIELRKANRPVLVVSDCCHAMSLVEQCVKDEVSPERIGIIAASESDEKVVAWLSARLRECWSHRRKSRLGAELLWGATLDHHFYPRDAGTEAT